MLRWPLYVQKIRYFNHWIDEFYDRLMRAERVVLRKFRDGVSNAGIRFAGLVYLRLGEFLRVCRQDALLADQRGQRSVWNGRVSFKTFVDLWAATMRRVAEYLDSFVTLSVADVNKTLHLGDAGMRAVRVTICVRQRVRRRLTHATTTIASNLGRDWQCETASAEARQCFAVLINAEDDLFRLISHRLIVAPVNEPSDEQIESWRQEFGQDVDAASLDFSDRVRDITRVHHHHHYIGP